MNLFALVCLSLVLSTSAPSTHQHTTDYAETSIVGNTPTSKIPKIGSFSSVSQNGDVIQENSFVPNPETILPNAEGEWVVELSESEADCTISSHSSTLSDAVAALQDTNESNTGHVDSGALTLTETSLAVSVNMEMYLCNKPRFL